MRNGEYGHRRDLNSVDNVRNNGDVSSSEGLNKEGHTCDASKFARHSIATTTTVGFTRWSPMMSRSSILILSTFEGSPAIFLYSVIRNTSFRSSDSESEAYKDVETEEAESGAGTATEAEVVTKVEAEAGVVTKTGAATDAGVPTEAGVATEVAAEAEMEVILKPGLENYEVAKTLIIKVVYILNS